MEVKYIMFEVLPNGKVLYADGEKVKTANELLANSLVVGGMGFGFERKPKATDLSRYIPRKIKKLL